MKKTTKKERKALPNNTKDVQLQIQEIFNIAGYRFRSIPWGFAEEDEQLQKTLRTVHQEGISAEDLYYFVNNYVEDKHRQRPRVGKLREQSLGGYKSWNEAHEAAEELANGLLNTTMIWYRDNVLKP